MRSTYSSVIALVVCLLASAAGSAQVEIYEAAAPKATRDANKVFMANTVMSTMADAAPVVEVPVDDTGIAAWEFLNPRRPQTVPAGADIEFRNMTADRTVQVTVAVTLTAAAGETLQQAAERLYPGFGPECTPETPAAPTGTCTLSVSFQPEGTGRFPRSVLLAQKDAAEPVRFTVRFSGEIESPPQPVAYLIAGVAERRAPRSIATIAAVASVGASRDPWLPDRGTKSRNCPVLCPDQPFNGDMRSHYTGAGGIEIKQTFGDLLDGKVNLTYRDGDLGAESTFKLSEYRFNIYSEPGWTAHYGRSTFAAPASGIAINEFGDGFRLAWRNVAATHLVKRASPANALSAARRDNEVWLLEASNVPICWWRRPGAAAADDPQASGRRRTAFFRTFSLIYLRGTDDNRPEEKKHADTTIAQTVFSAREYQTLGGHVTFAIPKVLSGTLAAYRSRREAVEPGAPCNDALHVCDGEGTVGLLTMTHASGVDTSGKARRTFTLSVGEGSADDPKTLTEDEGYIGETARYAPDHIFLATLARGISTRDFVDITQYNVFPPGTPADVMEQQRRAFHALDLGPLGLGPGLSNKRYVGFRFVDNTFSLLALVANLFKIPETDIRSRATIITLNDYRLRNGSFNDKHAGNEADIEFKLETPRAVTVSLRGAYYWPGDAVKQIIRDDVWSFSTGISLSL